MQEVLLFGAGARGQRFHKLYGSKYRIKGILDNNPKLHGNTLNGVKIYSPAEALKDFSGEIIIASDYYEEIYAQLVNQHFFSPSSIKLDQDEILKLWSFSAWAKRVLPRCIFFLEKYFPCAIDFLLLLSNFSKVYPSKLTRLHISSLQDLKPVQEILPAVEEEHVSPKYLSGNATSVFIKLPPVNLYFLENVRCQGNGRNFKINERELVIETVQNFNGYPNYSCGYVKAHGYKNAFIMEDNTAQRIPSGILISCFSSANYYHWMIEALPQLMYLRHFPELDSEPVLVSRAITKILPIYETFKEAVGPKREVIYLDDSALYEIERLYLISQACNIVPNIIDGRYTTACGYFRQDTLLRLRDFGLLLEQALISKPAVGKRILLGRKGMRRRYNQDEIFSLLQPFGFQLVFMEELSISEQICVFQQADYVVGPTGAAWVGLLFMQPHTNALCWMASEYGDIACYAQIAHAMSVRLTYIKYETGAKSQSDLYSLGYQLSTDDVITWIKQQGLSPVI